MSDVDIVRGCLEAYVRQDRETAERLIADDFVFNSPQDDHIDRAAFFERCFPTADRVRSQVVLDAVPAADGKVFMIYEYELKTGVRHRNVELNTVRDGRITEVQVFFGGTVG